MECKYILFLLGFNVKLRDRRTGDEETEFMIVTAPEEHPDELEEAYEVIRRNYGGLGYDVLEIEYQESKVKELDLKAEYDAAQTKKEWETPNVGR